MTVLFTGRGTSGSFAIRGEQLGRAVGGVVQPNALDVAGHSLAVIVKRPGDVLARLQAAQVPIVWDVVDAFPQPVGNSWTGYECIAWLAQQVGVIKPVGIVAATKRMAQDCEAFGVPVLALPHHHRPGIALNPIREQVKVVGYEGGEQYLGRWRKFLEVECSKRGWRFVVNPANLADLDIVVGLRDQSGYAPRQWKSGIKGMNACGSGTPCVLSREAGYLEQATGGEHWADTQADVVLAFNELESQEVRREVARKLLAGALTLDAAAATYRTWLQEFLC